MKTGLKSTETHEIILNALQTPPGPPRLSLLLPEVGVVLPMNPEVSISHIPQGMHRDFTGIYYRKVRLENAFNL